MFMIVLIFIRVAIATTHNNLSKRQPGVSLSLLLLSLHQKGYSVASLIIIIFVVDNRTV